MTEQEQAKTTDADHPFFLTKRIISHDEAREIAQRLINSHFRKEPGARVGIPARPDYDDDLLIIAYIRQQAAASTRPARPEQWSEVSAVSMRRAICLPYCVSYGTDRQGACDHCFARSNAALALIQKPKAWPLDPDERTALGKTGE